MMEQPGQFRSAFRGFNREDVVRYMEYTNNKHASQVAQLTNELEYLRGKQGTRDAEQDDSLEKNLSDARSENETLRKRVAELEKQLAEKPDMSPPSPSESELEAYRRAEQVERNAKVRARLIGQQTAQALEKVSGQIENTSDEITQISEQLCSLLEKLQSIMTGSRRTVREAADAAQGLSENQE